jgi:hypothetical protein
MKPMNALCTGPQAIGWARAADYLGHKGYTLNTSFAFDSFRRASPHIVLVGDEDLGEGFSRALSRWPCKVVSYARMEPAADCLPTFKGGQFRKEFACDVAIVGEYKSHYDKYIQTILKTQASLKIFGSGNWPVANFVGQCATQDYPDIYRSAGWIAELNGNASSILAIWASGGLPISICKWEESGVEGLDKCPKWDEECGIPELYSFGWPTGNGNMFVRRLRDELFARTLSKDTLAHRLFSLLEGGQ